MKTYWDLDESERAALSRDDVAKWADAELMLKGVLASGNSPDLLPEPDPKLGGATYYRVCVGAYDMLDELFATAEDAQAFLALRPLRVRGDWTLGVENQFADTISDVSVKAVQFPSRMQVEAARAVLKEACAAKEENRKRKAAWEEQTKKVEDALKGLWEDWHACREKAMSMDRVAQTFGKYLALAEGDKRVATKFLLAAFTSAEVEAAERWTKQDMGMTGAP